MDAQNQQYPIIIEISKNKKPFKVNRNDPAFDRPISEIGQIKNQTVTFKFFKK